ncbi:MAG: DUF2851 family protein [Candidatus Marinimicrobia bacterium]|nr:DUF2851 family protein [Candidatus Neomarinimicrobiota bacterium]
MYYNEGCLQHSAIAEGIQYNWHLCEEDLVKWWLRQAQHMDNLWTLEGSHIIVLDAGQRNDGPGPDIFRSRIILDDIEMSGDVEMHTRAGDWYRHGHENDSRYQDVMLHVIVGGAKGPDIPTLVVDSQWLGASQCLAQQKIKQSELLIQAFIRFKRKERHLKLLSVEGKGYSPLLLGMIEMIMAGAARHERLHRAAIILELENWPDNNLWKGSNLSFKNKPSIARLLQGIRDNPKLFQPEHWESLSQNSWKGWDSSFTEFYEIGLSRNHCREWLVNILAPLRGEDWGFELWQEMKIFRHYGLEKPMLRRLGLPGIRSVADQQGILRWNNIYCSQGLCSNCPLTHSHHALTHIN